MSVYSFPVINLRRTGSNIEQLRRKAGLSVRQLQDYFGFEYPQAIYKWQHGECLPTVDNLLALARLLKVPMEKLLVCEDQELPSFWPMQDALVAFSPHPTPSSSAKIFPANPAISCFTDGRGFAIIQSVPGSYARRTYFDRRSFQ